jgi:23S rRNA (adenine2503-C2)-methyltransferase
MTLSVHSVTGDETLARVFVGALDDGSRVEFVESVQPPVLRSEKWVLIVSTLKGCPVGCPICDAGGNYRGRLTAAEILAQIDHLVRSRWPDGRARTKRVKIQFARMGEPAFNDAVIDVLKRLPGDLGLPGLMPCLSTVAPAGREAWFGALERVKKERFGAGAFQMQFSLHTTSADARRRLIPIRTWSLAEIAAFGSRFFEPGDRLVTLNFAPARGYPLEPEALAPLLSPAVFAIKLTPINPTFAARESGLAGLIDPADDEACARVASRFEALGYTTILSIGALAENAIGSNCGQYVEKLRRSLAVPPEAPSMMRPCTGRMR